MWGYLRKVANALVRRTIGNLIVLQMMNRFSGKDMWVNFDELEVHAPKEKIFAKTLYKLKKRQFEPLTIKIFQQVLSPGMTVLDIGANLGVYTLLAASRVGPTGKVFAFEPDPYVYPWLVRNIQINNLEDRVNAIQKAVASREGKAILFSTHGSGRSSLFRNRNYERERGEKLEIETIALDIFCDKDLIPDIIKIDVEGAEIEVLKGAKEVIARTSNIYLFIECAPRALREAGYSPNDLIDILRDMGFVLFFIDDIRFGLTQIKSARESKRIVQEIDRTVGHANLLCIKGKHNSSILSQYRW